MLHSNSMGLRNLTADDEKLLAGVGIASKEQFEKLGADKTYSLITDSGQPTDADLLYRLRGAERDLDWKILAERDARHDKSRFIDVDEP